MIAWHIAPTGSRTRPYEPLRDSISTVGGESSIRRASRPHGRPSTIAQTRQDRVHGTGSGSLRRRRSGSPTDQSGLPEAQAEGLPAPGTTMPRFCPASVPRGAPRGSRLARRFAIRARIPHIPHEDGKQREASGSCRQPK